MALRRAVVVSCAWAGQRPSHPVDRARPRRQGLAPPLPGGVAELGDLAPADEGVGVACGGGRGVRLLWNGAGRGRGGNMVVSGA